MTVILFLAACGFEPVYGPHGRAREGVVAAQMNNIAIDTIPERDGQVLRNFLVDRMHVNGRPQQSAYHLGVNLTIAESELGIRRDATAARAQVTITARYTLTRPGAAKPELTAETNSIVSYNKVDAQYAELVSEKSARERGLRDIADKIVNRVGLYLAGR